MYLYPTHPPTPSCHFAYIDTMMTWKYKQIHAEATLKKILFPVQRPGVYITAEWDLFFFILPPNNFLVKISSFSYQKKKKRGGGGGRFCGRPAGHNFGHPLDRKQTFFKGGLTLRAGGIYQFALNSVPTRFRKNLFKNFCKIH